VHLHWSQVGRHRRQHPESRGFSCPQASGTQRRQQEAEIQQKRKLQELYLRNAGLDPTDQWFPEAVRAEVTEREAVPGAEAYDPGVLQEAPDDALAATIAVDVSRVEERDPGLDRRPQHRHRVGLGHVAPVRAELPCAEPDDRNRPASPAENPLLHDS